MKSCVSYSTIMVASLTVSTVLILRPPFANLWGHVFVHLAFSHLLELSLLIFPKKEEVSFWRLRVWIWRYTYRNLTTHILTRYTFILFW